MSDNKQLNENAGPLDSLSKESLLNILRTEFESENTDVELIKSVSRALDEKFASEDADADAAWERFLRSAPETESLYDPYEDEAADISAASKKRASFRRMLLAVTVAAAVLVGGAAVAKENGVDLWRTVVTWTAETFGFSQKSDAEPSLREIPEQLEELAEVFDRYGINREKLPTYMPEGFLHSETKVVSASTCDVFISTLVNGDASIVLQYRLHKDDYSFTELQKDIPSPQILELDGIEYYISTNENQYFAAWLDGDLEGQIFGVDSYDELEKIINSLHGR